ncbi:flagellar hook-length control protein [Ferrigenium kumadai]|uniref:Flagellar hook-length control protein n=1 Tax=Ferrigenium kumadai TaxID=1682490 RepID=A0AAN1SZU9_9PROT|nr:flagellar hook-length control protein FliK [Ferrigenium kumadai]BBI98774.1 flagellar hook-length control protein [Ferrigenium kumadai]
MTNLPITSNSPQSAGNITNTALANSAPDDAQTAAGPGGADPFAALLARQIGGADSALLNLAQISIAANAADSNATANGKKDAQDPAAITADAGAPSDAANSVMAMLLQIPQEIRTPATQEATGNAALQPTGKNNTATPDIAMIKTASRGDAQPGGPANMSLGKTDMTAANQPITPDALVKDMVKQAELPVSLTTPAPANAAQAIAPSVLAAAMPNMQPGKVGDNPQTIATPLGNSGWADDFSQKITWMSTQQNQVAELHLNPPDLGPLDVVLKISDSQATALFTSPHGAVREAVENALPKLREMLADNGITLGNTTVSDQAPRDRDTQGFMGQGSGTAAQQGGGGSAARLEGASTAAAQVATVRRHNGMVDTFA